MNFALDMKQGRTYTRPVLSSFFASLAVFLALSLIPASMISTEPASPAIPQSGVASAGEGSPVVLQTHAAPVRLIIPSIGIDTAIVGVGVDESGAMAVPSGSSNTVGWYDGGVVPGDAGSAVLDAHVFAAFAALHNIQVGDDVYVVTASGERLRFVVQQEQTLPLSSLSPSQLFRSSETRDLNLITCAGSLTRDRSTYDHRLIVYATLVDQR